MDFAETRNGLKIHLGFSLEFTLQYYRCTTVFLTYLKSKLNTGGGYNTSVVR